MMTGCCQASSTFLFLVLMQKMPPGGSAAAERAGIADRVHYDSPQGEWNSREKEWNIPTLETWPYIFCHP